MTWYYCPDCWQPIYWGLLWWFIFYGLELDFVANFVWQLSKTLIGCCCDEKIKKDYLSSRHTVPWTYKRFFFKSITYIILMITSVIIRWQTKNEHPRKAGHSFYGSNIIWTAPFISNKMFANWTSCCCIKLLQQDAKLLSILSLSRLLHLYCMYPVFRSLEQMQMQMLQLVMR